MRKYDNRLVGLLGAVILHLSAAIIFMLVKIGSLNTREYAREYELVLEESIDQEDQAKGSEPMHTTIEQVLSGDEELLNIARNLARQPDVNIDREDYIDMVKEEMIRDGKLGAENYIDEWKRLRENEESGQVILERKDEEKKADDNQADSKDLASKYSGPTRIYYSLKGRTHAYLPLPIYKCEGAGKIVLAIQVDPKGTVTEASVIGSESTTNDPCLVETAVKTALVSRFNADINAGKSQSGTLTYHFVAQ